MYVIKFYEDEKGYSELYESIYKLANEADHNKNSRIQFQQITLYIELLKIHGTRLSTNITKHIKDELWELRPGNNRILYFYNSGNEFVLLHMFRKKTQKTPKSEIDRALNEIRLYILRNGDNKK